MAAAVAEPAGRALRPTGPLLAPLGWLMRAIEVPMAWLQRRAGYGGVIVVLLAPNMLVFGVFVLLPMALNVV